MQGEAQEVVIESFCTVQIFLRMRHLQLLNARLGTVKLLSSLSRYHELTSRKFTILLGGALSVASLEPGAFPKLQSLEGTTCSLYVSLLKHPHFPPYNIKKIVICELTFVDVEALIELLLRNSPQLLRKLDHAFSQDDPRATKKKTRFHYFPTSRKFTIFLNLCTMMHCSKWFAPPRTTSIFIPSYCSM